MFCFAFKYLAHAHISWSRSPSVCCPVACGLLEIPQWQTKIFWTPMLKNIYRPFHSLLTTAASSLPPCGRAPKFSLHALDFGNKPFELVLWSASALRSTFSRRNYDTVRLIIMWREFSTLKDCLDKKFNNLGIKWTKLKMQIIQRNLSMQEARLKADKL